MEGPPQKYLQDSYFFKAIAYFKMGDKINFLLKRTYVCNFLKGEKNNPNTF